MAASPETTRRRSIRLTSFDDSMLVELAKLGRDDAWAELIRRFGGLIASITRRHGLSPSDGADVAQHTWMQLHRHLPELREPGRVGAWLAATARHECLRLLRRRDDPVDPAAMDERRSRVSDDPVDELIAMELQSAVRRAVIRLSPRCQHLLKLLMWEEAPYGCVTRTLDMPVGSIGPTRQRCLRSLGHEPEIVALR